MERTPVIWRVVFVAVFLGAWILFMTSMGPPPIVVGLLAVAVLVNIALVMARRRRQHRRNDAPSTGRIVRPPTDVPRPLPARFVGGGNLPGNVGRMNATTPLVVLELGTGSLALRVRPRFIAGLFGPTGFRADPSEVSEMLPVRSGSQRTARTGILGSYGIGILPADGSPILYFWCGEADCSVILEAATRAGFQVSWEEREARIW